MTDPAALPEPGIDCCDVPSWWLTRPGEIREFLESLDGVTVEEIGRTAGGRPIVAAACGQAPPRGKTTSASMASAVSGRKPEAFFRRGDEGPQTLLFVGAAHGTEIEGTVGMLNYLNIAVTGRDLLGREMPEVADRARRLRLVIVPILNVDGRQRYPDHCHWIGCDQDYFSMISQGRWKTGQIMRWPTGKLHWPVPLDEVSHLGTYYNDAGYNLVYDGPFAGDCQPETTALIRLCRREQPDGVILSHSNNGSLAEAPASTMAPIYRQKAVQLGAAIGVRCLREGFVKHRIPSRTQSYAGHVFYQGDAVHHACGALPLLIEFPQGWDGVPATHREILDIALAVLDETAAFAEGYRLRPPLDG